MATPNSGSARPTLSRWIVVLVGLLVLSLGAINLVAEVKFSMSGEPAPATILATEGGIGKMHSITARANVAPRNATPFEVEIHDTLGNTHWKEGDKVEVLCAHIHADHLSCVADLWFDRYGFPAIMAIVGALVLLGVWKLRGR